MAYDTKHPSWQTLKDLLDEFVHKYSGIIYDKELHKEWDPGQAICRGVYGPNWMTHPDKLKADKIDQPAPQATIDMLRDWIKNGLPEWAECM